VNALAAVSGVGGKRIRDNAKKQRKNGQYGKGIVLPALTGFHS
jgi:hypothetical protein